jgi:hypothetical protein
MQFILPVAGEYEVRVRIDETRNDGAPTRVEADRLVM